MKKFHLFLIVSILYSCNINRDYKSSISDPMLFQESVQNLTDIIVHDIFSPPVASRVYLYPTMAAYEIIAKFDTLNYNSMVGKLSGLKPIPNFSKKVNPYLASLYAFNSVGKALIFSEDKMKLFLEKQDKKIKKLQVPRSVMNASKAYAEQVSNHILSWASDDLYNETRTYPKYTIQQEDHYWKPTAPDYMDGIEPHWNKIRTLVLESANQFQPKPPLDFDLNEGSPFQLQLNEVYEIVKNIDEEQTLIANFWDCNPYVTHHKGHALFATKKITPGGHWVGITGIATTKAKSDFSATVNAYANVTVGLFDAFISCWDEKWNSLVVRPETLIHKYYDEDWLPLLQTPPFPEYTSGHSVISRTAAVILTELYGHNFSFEDTTEIPYGLPTRSFNSFLHAADEAAISRLYGGIHYMMAIEEGVIQGDQIGKYIVEKLTSQIETNQKRSN